MATVFRLSARAVWAAMRVLERQPDGHGLAFREVWDRIQSIDPELEQAWDATFPNLSTTIKTKLRYDSINLVKAGWLRKGGRVWQLTGLGRRVIDNHRDDMDGLLREANSRYSYWSRERASFDTAAEILEGLSDLGAWVELSELAELVGLAPEPLMAWLHSTRPRGWYLALAGGEVPGFLESSPGELDEWRTLLENAGVYDPAASSAYAVRALMDKRNKSEQLQELALQDTLDMSETVPPRRAWLIRGSDVNGAALIRSLWRDKHVCTVAADRISGLAEGTDAERVKEVVDIHYSDLNQARRTETAQLFHTFLSRMREGDIVATTDGDQIYLGQITGPASQLVTGAGTVLQRPVEWTNLDQPLALHDLPAGLAGPLGNPSAGLVELSEFVGDLEVLLDEDPEQAPTGAGETPELPDATDELVAKLTMRDITWLQDCVELLRDRPQLIMHGPPGTGKTHTALALARHLTSGREANVQLVQFHPAYSYEDFFEGFRPRAVPSTPKDPKTGRQGSLSDGGSGIVFDLVPGPLKTIAEKARNNPGEVFVLVIDEINRGNLAQVFGELYFLLEYRKEFVHLLYGSDEARRFRLPANLIIIGTMNTTDRSIALMDAAMRRRFWFMELHPSKAPIATLLEDWLNARDLPQDAVLLLDTLNERIGQALLEDRDFRIGPTYFLRPTLHTNPKGLERVWRHQILPLLKELHWADDLDVEEEYGLAALRGAAGLSTPASEPPDAGGTE
ncbi:AAA family ATPase [Nonomuraea muscovyensis]|uniref:McrB family protein n=1 Tax=Nonomuraea muscovyensis TaxID=1124761 RepID=UPI0033D904C9